MPGAGDIEEVSDEADPIFVHVGRIRKRAVRIDLGNRVIWTAKDFAFNLQPETEWGRKQTECAIKLNNIIRKGIKERERLAKANTTRTQSNA